MSTTEKVLPSLTITVLNPTQIEVRHSVGLPDWFMETILAALPGGGVIYPEDWEESEQESGFSVTWEDNPPALVGITG